jgi:signal transduction histidine kinase
MLGTVLVIRDVTEQKKLQLQLEHRTAEQERASRELQQFAYATSHDLKAPLRAINSITQWIERDLNDVLKDETREQMQLLRGRVHRMQCLLTDLLRYTLAANDEGAVDKVDARELMSDVIELSDIPAGFAIDVECDLPPFKTAMLPLKRVLMNLVSNAIKHHDRKAEGRVKISAREKGSELEFLVSDNGPGIPLQFQETAFQMFQTLKPRDDVEGSGMGLAIVKKLVETAGGTIAIESHGRGTTCRFTWPRMQ